MKINYIIKPHKRDWVTKWLCCVFEHNCEEYYADRCFAPDVCEIETMIFPWQGGKDGKVTSWGELYCDRTGKSLCQCIKEFILLDN